MRRSDAPQPSFLQGTRWTRVVSTSESRALCKRLATKSQFQLVRPFPNAATRRSISTTMSNSPSGGAQLAPRSLATVSLPGSLPQKLDAARRAGFGGVEICQRDLDETCLTGGEVRDLAASLGLEIFLWQPLRDVEAVPAEVLDANLRRARQVMGLLGELGTSTLIACSNVSPAAIADDRRAAGQLGDLADLAASYGVRVAYEALSWGTRVRTYEHAWRLVEAADRPNLGVCLDSFHILAAGSDLAGIGVIPAGKIMAVQLADAPLMQLDFLDWSRHHRRNPLLGDLDVHGFTKAVLAAGAQVPWALEIFRDWPEGADPWQAAVDGMRSLDNLERAVCGVAVPG